MTEKPIYRIITAEQRQLGWIELRDGRQIHHNYLVIAKRDDGTYVVRDPVSSIRKLPADPK